MVWCDWTIPLLLSRCERDKRIHAVENDALQLSTGASLLSNEQAGDEEGMAAVKEAGPQVAWKASLACGSICDVTNHPVLNLVNKFTKSHPCCANDRYTERS